MAVAQAWCVSTPGAMMAKSMPVTREEKGTLAFNALRIYSARNYPYLVRHKQQYYTYNLKIIQDDQLEV